MFNLDYNIYKNVEDIFCDIKFLKQKGTFYSSISSCFDIEPTSFYENENNVLNYFCLLAISLATITPVTDAWIRPLVMPAPSPIV